MAFVDVIAGWIHHEARQERDSHVLARQIQRSMQDLLWPGLKGRSFLSITRYDNERVNITMAGSLASLPVNVKIS